MAWDRTNAVEKAETVLTNSRHKPIHCQWPQVSTRNYGFWCWWCLLTLKLKVGSLQFIITFIAQICILPPANLWMTSGNRIVMVSPSSGNLSLTLDTGRHVIGLSNPALATAEEEEAATVFVTELGPRGASIYRVTADQRSQQLLSPEGWDSFNVTYSHRMCRS